MEVWLWPIKVKVKIPVPERISDWFAKLARSWGFVIFQLAFVATWVILNSTKILVWDRYPFEILKLVLTVEGFFMGSMILMSQHRRTEGDRKILYQDFVVNLLMRKELKANKSETDEVLDILKNKNDHPKSD